MKPRITAQTEHWLFERPPLGGYDVEFRLALQGDLPPSKSGTLDAKHRIRRELHPQLRTLWHQDETLRNWFTAPPEGHPDYLGQRADDYARCGFRFVPLVALKDEGGCALDILILRRQEPNKLFTGAGDIDARVKTLLDGLRMPQQCSELGGAVPEDGEDPFFVLLEDDRVIHELNITTDRLLVPPKPHESQREIVAIIKVRTRTFSLQLGHFLDGR
jgi:hypothetical protein